MQKVDKGRKLFVKVQSLETLERKKKVAKELPMYKSFVNKTMKFLSDCKNVKFHFISLRVGECKQRNSFT